MMRPTDGPAKPAVDGELRQRRPRSSSPWLVVVALVIGLTVAGCGGGHSSPRRTPAPGSPAQRTSGDRTPSTRQRLQSLLERRARALAAREPVAYAATATTASRAADRRAARDAARLGLTEIRIELRHAHVHGRRAKLDVVTGWALRGISGTFTSVRSLRAVRTHGRWRIAGVLGTRSRLPWEVADLRRHDVRHFVVLAPAALPLGGLRAALAQGYASIASALPRAHLRRRYLALVAPDARVTRALTSDIRGVEGLAAVADSSVRQIGPARRVQAVLSQRLLVVWPEFSVLSPTEQRRVIAHELTHLVLAGSTSGRTPSWLVEGIALYVSGDRRSGDAAAALRGAAGVAARHAMSLRRLSGAHAIADLQGIPQTAAYAYASAAAFAIADRYGRRALLRLYEAFDDPGLRGHAGPRLTDRAMRRTLGTSLETFERDLRAALT